MKFQQTLLKDAYLIEPEKHSDHRGFFARTFCVNELAAAGLNHRIVQASISYNEHAGTFRGMHFQAVPHEEDKIVSCTQGAILDIIVDVRPHSSQYKQWVSVTLSAENRHMLYIPKGFAHGFFTLTPQAQVAYMMTEFYHPESARGFRWDDPEIGIELPGPVQVISERDQNYPTLESLMATHS